MPLIFLPVIVVVSPSVRSITNTSRTARVWVLPRMELSIRPLGVFCMEDLILVLVVLVAGAAIEFLVIWYGVPAILRWLEPPPFRRKN